MKILYCIAGVGCYCVVEGEIVTWEGFIISAKRAFSITAAPTQVKSMRGDNVGLMISAFDDVMLNCSSIASLSEKAPLHQEIMGILEGEKANEN